MRTVKSRLLAVSLLAVCVSGCGAQSSSSSVTSGSSNNSEVSSTNDQIQTPKIVSKGNRTDAGVVSFTGENSGFKNVKSQILAAVREGPNFAGHYVIATWSCGTGCEPYAIVDLQTGRIRWIELPGAPDESIDADGYSLASDELRTSGSTDLDDGTTKCIRKSYRWTGTGLRLVRDDSSILNGESATGSECS